MYRELKAKAYGVLQKGWFVSLILILIFCNIPLSIFSTFSTLTPADVLLIENADFLITVVFTMEYLLRLWTADLSPDYHGSRIRFMLRPAMIIDLLAIIPVVYFNIRIFRAFRVLRLFRILKIIEYSGSLKLMMQVFYSKLDVLVSVGFVMGFMIIVNSFIIFYFENKAQPEVFKNLYDSIWFTAMTFSTAGSPLEPVTSAGKTLKILTALGGILLFAVYSGIFSSGFIDARKQVSAAKTDGDK